ncbi:MAG TPA: DUF3299 domain-containing protein, partial [Bryobacteraceae bacterium]|nr:DUF3299 domain-containing protein [Bryobacteraceae bacterium]
TRPNLAYRSFPQDASAPGVRTLEWSTLYALEKKRHRREPIPPEVENGVVRLPGYMLPVEPSRDPHREVSRFLLVPDPGNWLHPAHADDGVLVSMAGSATTPLRDQHPVWVQGRLFLTPPDRGPVDAPCSLIATKVD